MHYVFSTDFGRLDHRGYLAAPYLIYKNENFFHPKWTTFFSTAAVFGTRMLNEYFYEVSPDYALSDRPTYRAKEGFMGMKFAIGTSWRFTDTFLLAFGYQGSSYRGVANESSPLMKARWTNSWAFAFIWKYYESDERGYK